MSKPRPSPKWAQTRSVGFSYENKRSFENKHNPVAWALPTKNKGSSENQ
ncbi:hypothetical protein [Neisseria sicca]|nr:hypothetical protein [Neisseria sicca]